MSANVGDGSHKSQSGSQSETLRVRVMRFEGRINLERNEDIDLEGSLSGTGSQ